MRGWYHPRGPDDIPTEVSAWLEPVAECLADLDAEAVREAQRRAGWGR